MLSVVLYALSVILPTWLIGFFLHESLGPNGSALLFLLIPLVVTIVFVVFSKDRFREIGIVRNFGAGHGKTLLKSLIEYFLLLIVVVAAGRFFLLGEELNAQALTTVLIQSLPLFVIISIQAFFEEIAWAGWLYNSLSKLSFHIKVLSITVIWMLWHTPFFIWTEQLIVLDGFDLLPIAIIFIQLLLSRYVYTWFRWKSGNLWWPTLAHGIANTSAFIVGGLLILDPDTSHFVIVFVAIGNLLYGLRLYFTLDSPLSKSSMEKASVQQA